MSTTGSTCGQAPAVAPEIPAPALVIIKSLKINTPEPFDGGKGKLQAFFSQVELFFGFNAERFPTNKQKVLFASTYLGGPAFERFKLFLTDFLNNEPDKRDDDTVEVTQNYSNFKISWDKSLATLTKNIWRNVGCNHYGRLDLLPTMYQSSSSSLHKPNEERSH